MDSPVSVCIGNGHNTKLKEWKGLWLAGSEGALVTWKLAPPLHRENWDILLGNVHIFIKQNIRGYKYIPPPPPSPSSFETIFYYIAPGWPETYLIISGWLQTHRVLFLFVPQFLDKGVYHHCWHNAYVLEHAQRNIHFWTYSIKSIKHMFIKKGNKCKCTQAGNLIL